MNRERRVDTGIYIEFPVKYENPFKQVPLFILEDAFNRWDEQQSKWKVNKAIQQEIVESLKYRVLHWPTSVVRYSYLIQVCDVPISD